MVDVKRAGRPGQEPPPPLDNDDEVDTKLGTGGQQAAPGELDSRIVEKFAWERDRIRQLSRNLISSTRTKLTTAVEIGRLLGFVRNNLAHGTWLKWLSTEIDMSERSARNFMTVAAAFEERSATVADLERSKTTSPSPPSIAWRHGRTSSTRPSPRPSTVSAPPSAMPRR